MTDPKSQLDAYKAHEQLPTIPIVPLPNLHIFVQPNPADKSTRFNVDTNPAYTKTQSFLYIVFSHILASNAAKWRMKSMIYDISKFDLDCRDHLRAKLGEERDVSVADIESYLSQTPPSVIFTCLNKKAGAIVWGEVRKGEEEDAAENELFISDEFLKVMGESLAPQDVAEYDKTLRIEFSKLLFSATVLHDIVHCLTKHFFGHFTIIPKLPDFEADGIYSGEAGRTFEKYYFGFLVEAWWKIEDIHKEPCLWYVDTLSAHYASHSQILVAESIKKVLHSLTKVAIWKLAEDEGKKVLRTMNNSTHRRYRGGGTPIPILPDMPEVKHLDYGLPDCSHYVRVGTVCAGSSQWFK